MTQRIFKFRVYDKHEKKMRYSYEDYNGKSWSTLVEPANIAIKLHISLSNYAYRNCLDDDNFILMQYTGLKDCKRTKEYPEGQEIYEGDILKEQLGDFLEIGKVIWGQLDTHGGHEANPFCFCKNIDPEFAGEGEQISSVDVVIGNILENPKLLEAKP